MTRGRRVLATHATVQWAPCVGRACDCALYSPSRPPARTRTGWLTPEYDKAKFGPSIKVPNGAIRNVEGSAEDTDGRRRSAPESEYDYEVRSLTANYEDQESPQRRAKDGYHDRVDAEDPMGRLEGQKLVPLHTYWKVAFARILQGSRVLVVQVDALGGRRAAPV